MTEIIEPVEAMLQDGASKHDGLKSMPKRTRAEQDRSGPRDWHRVVDRDGLERQLQAAIKARRLH